MDIKITSNPVGSPWKLFQAVIMGIAITRFSVLRGRFNIDGRKPG
ncbi:hypothetical protein [Antarcticibacterium sp. 1MA-6-2]|nr:hypothetical protein [Antarcticibacterium sp. 1MA-6-2]